jgi:Diacylglycerol kinase catalytic domain
MLKIGLISNPGSERNRRGLDDIHAASTDARDLVHVVAEDGQNLAEILADLARREIGLLVISGGDGTVQRLLTELLETRPFERPPPVAILPRGMANMTAGDVGLRGRLTHALPRLLETVRTGGLAGRLERRHVLRVENIKGLPPQRCMFLGAGAIYDAIEFCCRKVYSRGLKGNLGMGLTLGGFLLGGLFGNGDKGPIRGHDIAITVDQRPVSRAPRLLVLATTLDRLVLGARPFWDEGVRPIRFTSIGHPPARLIRSAPKVLYGWRRATLPGDAYVSGGAERLALGLSSAFTLDGELLEPEPRGPLLVTAPDRVAFVRL